jgi:adenylate kinase
LIYISTSFLIAEEIRKDTIHGRKIKSQYLNSEMIDSFLLEKLIEDRVSKKDCKLQGFVLEGYPKNKDQFENIKNLKLNPTLIVAIDASK